MSLGSRLARQIAEGGSISVAAYMDRCLHDPLEGYYATRPKLGGEGDFITAPHVSQMFGELLGLWAAEMWRGLGRPSHLRLVELGPGDGLMMSDVLRAAKAVPDFLAACEVWLVETSAPLRSRQEQAMAGAPAPVRWAEGVAAVPADAPLIMLANEFLDCLPVHQAVGTRKGWAERKVGLDERGNLTFLLGDLVSREGAGPTGSIVEWSDDLAALGGSIGALIRHTGGAALFIDYGRDAPGCGDTLQALRGHGRESPLAHPGEADLTAHVDFPSFLAGARDAGAVTTAIITQACFLRGLGIEARAAALATASPEKAALIGRQLARLISPDQMGELFKVACVHCPSLTPQGFEGRA